MEKQLECVFRIFPKFELEKLQKTRFEVFIQEQKWVKKGMRGVGREIFLVYDVVQCFLTNYSTSLLGPQSVRALKT
jgi:hypothetical protein